MNESRKIECPACKKLVSSLMPSCPFCTQALPRQTGYSKSPNTWVKDEDAREVVSEIAELEAAKETFRQSQPTFTGTIIVTGPISGFMSLVKPSYGSGVVQICEILLAILALPTIVIGVIATMVGIKRWGKIPIFFIVSPAALAILITWKMPAPVAFPVLLVSLIAFGIKSVIGITAKIRQFGR